MNENNTLNLKHFEIVTAITQCYEVEIIKYLLKEDDEVLQMEFAELIMNLYFAYMKDETPQSLLSMIESRKIPLSQVTE